MRASRNRLHVLLLLAPALLLASARPSVADGIVVELRTQGPHAVDACAETAARSGQPLQPATRDGSDSLDGLARRLGVREVRALFRRPDGRSFAAQRAALRERTGGGAATDLAGVYRIRLAPGVDAGAAAALYAADPHVVFAQPDFRMDLDFTPDDPFLLSSGSWGQPYADLWGLERVRAPEAWSTTTGEGAVVAVIDTGIDYEHPDLADNVWVNPGEDTDGNGRVDAADWNGVDDDGNGFVDDLRGWNFAASPEGDADPWDDNGHGTHVSGIVAAVGGNGLGISGVAPRARIMALKGFDASGHAHVSDLARAIVYAASNGADVINDSWSCSEPCPRNPVIEEAVLLAHARGVVVVTSAGNHGNDVVRYSPENRSETLVVAASREDDERAGFSGTGLLLDLAAPGSGRRLPGVPLSSRNILSLLASGAPPGWSASTRVADAYVREAGTSMSAPHVAGAAALLRALHPDLSPDDVRDLLRATARDVGPKGHDAATGAGILDVAAAVARGAPPGVRGRFTSPAPDALIVPDGTPVPVLGSAGGAAFEGYDLAYGRGLDPEAWHPIPPASQAAVRDGLLGRFHVSDLADGTWVLRLTVAARDGERAVEFLPLSLERTRPYAVSEPGRNATAPDVDHDLVVFESAPSLEVEPPAGDDGHVHVEIADLREGRETRLPADGDQRSPRISRRRVVFLDRSREPQGEIASCVLDRDSGDCPTEVVVPGPAPRGSIAASGDRIVWLESDGATWQALQCGVGSRGPCAPRPIDPVGSPAVMALHGRRLVWRGLSVGDGLHTCLLDLATGSCPARDVDVQDYAGFFSAPVAAGRLFVWEGIGFDGGEVFSELWLCAMADDGSCPALRVARGGAESLQAAVSGHRVVWSASQDGEARSIYFCEYDPVAHACPVQRLTGSLAPQRRPAISGRRVVFEDGRDGPSRIYAIDLPALRVIGRRHVREGTPLRLRVATDEPAGGSVAVDATLVDGTPVESLGMRLLERGPRGAVLLWRPAPGQAGRYAVTFAGHTDRGLTARETVEIEVRPRPRSRGAR